MPGITKTRRLKPAPPKLPVQRGSGLQIRTIGAVRSVVNDRGNAAKQGSEGAPDVRRDLEKFVFPGGCPVLAG